MKLRHHITINNGSSAGQLKSHVLPAHVLLPDTDDSRAGDDNGAEGQNAGHHEHDQRSPAGPPYGALYSDQPDDGSDEASGRVEESAGDPVDAQDDELDHGHGGAEEHHEHGRRRRRLNKTQSSDFRNSLLGIPI